MYDDDGVYIAEEECSSLARGFGFSSDDEFNDYCDEMEAEAIACMNEPNPQQ